MEAGPWHIPVLSAGRSSLPSLQHQTFSCGLAQHLAPSHQGPSVCKVMTSPLWAGIPAFCCAELLTLSWCQMALEADDFISFKGARDLSALLCRNQCASSLVEKPTRGARHSSGYDPTKGPKSHGFQFNMANSFVLFTLSDPLCLICTTALRNTIESGGPDSSTSSVVMPFCACKGRDCPAFSFKSQRWLSGACTGCWGDQEELFALHQPLSPKLSKMGGLSQTRPSMGSSWTSGQDNPELL